MYVYVITNSVNGKIYVGQHVGDDLEAYFAHNVKAALANRGNKTYLYKAIRKYGADSFTIEPLIVDVKDKIALDEWEKLFISMFETQNSDIGYNITGGGGGRLGTHHKHTEEFKKQVSLRHKGKVTPLETRIKISLSQKGRKFTEEHKQALRLGQLGKKKRRSKEHCLKISENKRRWWAERKKKVGDNVGITSV